MTKLTDSVYLVLSPKYNRFREVVGMNIEGTRKTLPALSRGQAAVKVALTIDSSHFENFIPTIEAEIDGHDLIVPKVEIITPEPEEDSDQ